MKPLISDGKYARNYKLVLTVCYARNAKRSVIRNNWYMRVKRSRL